MTPGERSIVEAVEQMARRLETADRAKYLEIQKQLQALCDAQKHAQKDINSILRGFPDEDPESHRRYHETIIAWRELRNQLVKEALINAGKVGFLASIGWILYAVWLVFKMELSK